MALDVLLVVLFSALLHAGWNALVRSSSDKQRGTLQVVCGAGALAALVVPALPIPAPASWAYVVVSGLIHVVYFRLVASAYRDGELSLAYPLMRGSAPVLTAVSATVLLGETPTLPGWLGIALICTGVLCLAGSAWHSAARHSAVPSALLNAGVIALYTVVDGLGARLSGHAASYTAWVFIFTAWPMLLLARLQHAHIHGRSTLPSPGTWRWHHAWDMRRSLLGGGGTLGAYGLALWAMTYAPIAVVAALRETSIVFATLIGVLFLHERLGRLRLLAVTLVCAGAAAIKLA